MKPDCGLALRRSGEANKTQTTNTKRKGTIVNSITKKILVIIAGGLAVPVLALAGAKGGGAAIGPVNGSGAGNNTDLKTLTRSGTNQFGTVPPNAQSSAGGFRANGTRASQNASVRGSSLKSKSTVRTTSSNSGTRR
jgi:hypothetical protein